MHQNINPVKLGKEMLFNIVPLLPFGTTDVERAQM